MSDYADLVARLRKMEGAVYLAAERGPADDLSDSLGRAADAIEALEARVARLLHNWQALDEAYAAEREAHERKTTGTSKVRIMTRRCAECGVYPADPPSRTCTGCDAYREHQS